MLNRVDLLFCSGHRYLAMLALICIQIQNVCQESKRNIDVAFFMTGAEPSERGAILPKV